MAQLLKNWTRKNQNHSNPILFKKTTTNFSTENHDDFSTDGKPHDWIFRLHRFRAANIDNFWNTHVPCSISRKKRHTSSISRKIWREKRTHCHFEKCLFAPRSRPIFHFEKQIGWKISGDFWRKNGSSISRKFWLDSGSIDLPTFTRPGGPIRIHTSAYLEHISSVPREPESTRIQNARL